MGETRKKECFGLDPGGGRIFTAVAFLSFFSFLLGVFFFHLPSLAFSRQKALFLSRLLPFFASDRSSFSRFFVSYALSSLAELRPVLLIFLSGMTTSAPIFSVALTSFRSFAVGFSAAGLLAFSASVRFFEMRYSLFALFFAWILMNTAYAAALASSHALALRPIEPIRIASADTVSYALSFLPPVGNVLLSVLLQKLALLVFTG